MAQHESKSTIVVGGRADSTFAGLRNQIQTFGEQIEGISRKLIDLGKESVNTYRTYENGILETRSVFDDVYGESKLNKIMDDLESRATKWAANSIFHTDDVANAMADAAHAGWTYEQMINGLPSSMLAAQAGGLDLSTTVDTLAKMLASTSTDFRDSERFIDEWAKSSDLVATDMGEMGEAFLRLGAAAQFADSNEELFTMLAVLAQVGTTGSNAGTAVRNMMIRLIAPTEKASDAMEALGVSEDELSGVMEGLDEQSAAAYERLRQFGFSPYDSQGNLKGFIEIFTDLNTALSQLPNEEEQLKVLTAIFPTRTMSYAQAMMKAVRDGSIFNIYDAVYGDSEGYAERKRDILMSGLTGTMETTASKYEELKRRIGESLSDDVTTGANALGWMLNAINNMNPVLFDALVGGLESIAVMGPLLAVGGHAINGVLSLVAAHPLGAALLFTAFGVRAFSEAMETLTAIRFEEFKNQFGEMDLDSDAIMQYVTAQTEAFTNAYSAVDMWEKKLSEASESYLTNSGELAGRLTTMYITKQEVTPEDAEALKGLGTQMGQALVDGINASFNAAAAFDLALLGEDGVADPKILALMQSMQALRDSMITNASTLGEELGAAMDEALGDGLITGQELSVIKAKMDEYNKAMAMIRDIESEAEFNAAARRVQGVSFDSYAAESQRVNDKYDADIADAWENYYTEVGRQEALLNYMVKNGQINPETGKAWTDAEAATALATFDEEQLARIDRLNVYRNEINRRMLDSLMTGNGFGDLYGTLTDYYSTHDETYGDDLANMFGYGGSEMAEQMFDALAGLMDYGYVPEDQIPFVQRLLNDTNAIMSGYYGGYRTSEAGQAARNELLDGYERLALEQEAAERQALAGVGINALSGMLGFGSYVRESLMGANATANDALFGVGTDALESMLGFGSYVKESLTGANAAINDALFGVGMGALEMVLDFTTEHSGAEVASEFTTEAQQTLNQHPGVWRVTPIAGGGGPTGGGLNFLPRMLQYAEGGRATSASIFGEAGAEWAIPEEHSKRTAELLDAARKASGFGWGELLAMSNGAGGGGRGQMVYSPTIYANDGRGVREALMEDKARMDKWWRDMQRRDALEVYA